MIIHVTSQHRGKRTIVSFHLLICLGVVSRHVGICSAEYSKIGLNQFERKLWTVVQEWEYRNPLLEYPDLTKRHGKNARGILIKWGGLCWLFEAIRDH